MFHIFGFLECAIFSLVKIEVISRGIARVSWADRNVLLIRSSGFRAMMNVKRMNAISRRVRFMSSLD